MPPNCTARMVWKRDDDGMWVALIRFDRQVEARLEPLDAARPLNARGGTRPIQGQTPIIRLSCQLSFIPFEPCGASLPAWG